MDDRYTYGLLRKYGDDVKNPYQKPYAERYSIHKRNLIEKHTFPVLLTNNAKIYINERGDIVFEHNNHTCYYADVSNFRISEFDVIK
jgi:hypothetical protein